MIINNRMKTNGEFAMISTFPRALIFDWDNTLVDSWEAIAAAMNFTRAQFGLPQWSLDEVRVNCTRAARDSFPEWFGAEWKKAYDIYYAGFDAERKKRTLQPLPGAAELLRWLKAQEIPLFVVSNKRGDYLRLEADKLQWRTYFTGIAGAQDAPRDKPAREHVDHVLALGGIAPGADIWFVGDSETDMLCAKNAGLTPVLIGEEAEAARLSVALVFRDCAGLHALLSSYAGETDRRNA
jgi:phosphoglycolate phosphatase